MTLKRVLFLILPFLSFMLFQWPFGIACAQSKLYENESPLPSLSVSESEHDISFAFVLKTVYALVCATLIGFSGILPLFLIPLESGEYLRSRRGQTVLNYWLSFALGSMLGDVFFHLLPESWSLSVESYFPRVGSFMGLWTLIGILIFYIIEKVFLQTQDESEIAGEANIKEVEGYLNLCANVIDNFTHGLGVGGSFLVSNQLGFLSTLCILIHEIPHEISDFILLLRAGFSKYGAAKAQLLTASGSIFGAIFALTADSLTTGRSKAYILPFTSGGFLYIALVSVAPTLIQEEDTKQSIYHVLLIAAGLISMFVLSWCV